MSGTKHNEPINEDEARTVLLLPPEPTDATDEETSEPEHIEEEVSQPEPREEEPKKASGDMIWGILVVIALIFVLRWLDLDIGSVIVDSVMTFFNR